MNRIKLEETAATIAAHALNSPQLENGMVVQNRLSPSFERFVYEAVRRFMILSMQDAVAEINTEFVALRTVLPAEEAQAMINATMARVNQILLTTLKLNA